MKRRIAIIVMVLWALGLHSITFGQGKEGGLSLEDFYRIVQTHHPIAQQANLIKERGALAVRGARGHFDPKIVSEYDRKQFEGKDYYTIWDSYVKVPTMLNVDLKAGHERNDGLFLNPENNVPTDGLYYAGVSIPIGQGLIHNSRNINLRKNQFIERDLQNDAKIVLNNLLFDANQAYWLWYEKNQKRDVTQENLTLINQRYEGIREAAVTGENAAIDSVEMLIQLQQWTNNLQEAELEYQNSLLLINNFIWGDSLSNASLYPTQNIESSVPDLSVYLDWAISNHPILQKMNIKSNILELDRKWNAEQLKPVLDFNYNILLSQDNKTEQSEPYFSNNYKMGINFVFPLLIRKERAKLKVVKIKLRENDLKTSQKSREIINKIQQSYNKAFTIRQMYLQQLEIQQNYDLMVVAERIKFDNGESSVFLLNSRENKKLMGEMKLIALNAKFQRAIGELKWASGLIFDELSTQN